MELRRKKRAKPVAPVTRASNEERRHISDFIPEWQNYSLTANSPLIRIYDELTTLVREYTKSREELKAAAQNVWVARHLHDRESEDDFRQEVRKARETYLKKLENLELDKPAQLKIVHDNENGEVLLEGTPRDWFVAHYHIQRQDKGRNHIDSIRNGAGDEKYDFHTGIKKPLKTYAPGTKKEPKTAFHSDAYLLAEQYSVYLTDKYKTKNSRSLCVAEILEHAYEEGEGGKRFRALQSGTSRQLDPEESIQAIEKYLLNNPKYDGKIEFTTEHRGGGRT